MISQNLLKMHMKSGIFIYLFIFGCAGSSLLRAGFLQSQRVGATLCCGARASHFSGFSCCGAWLQVRGLHYLWHTGSVVVARGLQSAGFSSCGAWAQLLHGMWYLTGPGLEPVSPALAGGLLTTAPPGKPWDLYFLFYFFNFFFYCLYILLTYVINSTEHCNCYYFFKLIYFWLHWVFVAACGLSLVVASGGYSLLRCAGFSLRWLLLLQSMGSRHMGFGSCSTQAQQLQHTGPRARGLQQL